jgi:hypothetical protein
VHWPNLTSVLVPVLYAVVGGVATRLYMPERMTKDLDVVIALPDAELVRKKRASGFVFVSELNLIRGSTWRAPNGQDIDVIDGEDVWWHEVILSAQANRDAQGQPVLTLPLLVLMKYIAGQAQDLADIDRLIGQTDDGTVAAIRQFFDRFLPDEHDDLSSFIALARLVHLSDHAPRK